jgi:hypothetical protein
MYAYKQTHGPADTQTKRHADTNTDTQAHRHRNTETHIQSKRESESESERHYTNQYTHDRTPHERVGCSGCIEHAKEHVAEYIYNITG